MAEDKIDEFVEDLIYIIRNNRTPKVKLTIGMQIGLCTLLSDQVPQVNHKGEDGNTTSYHLWELKCVCGGHIYRTSDYLQHAVKKNIKVRCSMCNHGYWGKSSPPKERAMTDRGKTEIILPKTGCLEIGESFFSPHFATWDHPFRNQIIIACEGARSSAGYINPDLIKSSQQDQWLFEIIGDGGWECDICCAIFPKGFGCVRCLQHVCHNCKEAGSHICPNTWKNAWKGEIKDDGLLQRRLDRLQEKQLMLVTTEEREKFEKGWLKRKKKKEEADKKEREREARLLEEAKERKQLKEKEEAIRKKREEPRISREARMEIYRKQREEEERRTNKESLFELYGGYEWDEEKRVYVKMKTNG